MTRTGSGLSLLDHFSARKDPRQSGKVVYPLPEILLLVLAATLAGADVAAQAAVLILVVPFHRQDRSCSMRLAGSDDRQRRASSACSPLDPQAGRLHWRPCSTHLASAGVNALTTLARCRARSASRSIPRQRPFDSGERNEWRHPRTCRRHVP